MKRKIALILLLIMTLLFCACEDSKGEVGVNLLENSGFEAGTGTEVSAWRLDRYDTAPPIEYYQVLQDDTAPEGNNVIKIESTTFNDARFVQDVQVEPDSYYCLSAMVKTELIEQRSTDSGANIGFLQTYCKSQYIKSNTDWTKITVYGKTEKDTEKVTVALRLGDYSADASGTVYFDDVSLEKVESVPEGISVLSMGAFQFASSGSSNKNEDKKAEPDDIIAKVTLIGVVLFALFAILLFKAYKSLNFGMREGFIVIAVAVVIRLIGSVLYKGFLVDINCFASWGEMMAANGITKFYSETSFCDYPPLYMIVLGLLTSITQPLGINLREGIGLLILKLPAIICDALAAIMIMKTAKKHVGEKLAVVLGIGYALLPTAIVNSAIWGQVDSILVLFMLITFRLIDEDKFGLSVLMFSIGLLFKPQAILFGPVMLLAAINEFYNIYVDFRGNNKKSGNARLLKGFGYLAASVLLFVLLSVTMRNGQNKVVLENGMEVDWLIGKYLNTLGSYDYATLSSFGLMGLLDGQWIASDVEVFAGVTYGTLGTVLLCVVGVLVVGIFAYLMIDAAKGISTKKGQKLMDRGWFWLLAALMLAGAVTVSTRTHERYIFPVIVMLIMAFVRFKDIRLIIISLGYSVLNFINVAGLLFLYEEAGVYFQNMEEATLNEAVFKIGSLLTVLLFIYQIYVTVSILLGKKREIKTEQSVEQKKNIKSAREYAPVSGKKTDELTKLLSRRSYSLPKVTKKDILICLLITAVYACVAFTNLGDVKAAQNFWYADKAEVYAVADLGEEKEFDTVKAKVNSSKASFKILTSSDGENYTLYQNVSIAERQNGWITIGSGGKARYIKLEAVTEINISELVILKDGEPLEVAATSEKVVPVDDIGGKAANLFDEQEQYASDAVNSVPQTSWISGGDHVITFEEPISLFGLRTYFKDAGNLTVAVPSSILGDQAQEEPWSDAIYVSGSNEGWADGVLQISDEFLGSVDKVLVKSEIPYNIGEIFFSTDAEMRILSVTDMDGNMISADSDFYNCFDESDKAKNYTALRGKAWSITSVSDYVIADFGEVTPIDRGYYRTSLCEGEFALYFSDDGETWKQQNRYTVEKSNLYYWHNTSAGSTRYVMITADSQFLKLIEIGFFEEGQSEKPIEIKEIIASNTSETGGNNLFDEQELVPHNGATYMNSMYFDEIYHARTAYESANGHSIYEWTHPPLGKDIMSWCVSLMGMTPFAWRFAGTVMGVLMVPAMYFLALLLFRKTSWATAAAMLMAFDGMHYVQTRIATIDSFGVFFIILMFLFMFWYYSLSFYDTPLKKTFVPLGLCGLAFGLGAASKWICLYAGAGLAVIFFITIFRRWREYVVASENLKKSTGETRKYLTHVCESFIPNTMYTLLFCIGAFIIVPLIIYCASYYPYWNAESETRKWYEIIISNQEAMFNYHSNLDATHPYQSDWYTWPVMETPMFYYAGPQDAENMSAIYAFGNPAVWYSGLVCTIAAIVVFFKRMFGEKLAVTNMANSTGIFSLFTADDEGAPDMVERDTRTLLFLILGIACNLLPWVGIERCIFIYHYFASVPFIILFTVYILRHFARRYTKVSAIVTVVLLVLTVVLFFMFRPVWTGTTVSRDYVGTWLHWSSSWFGFYFPKG